MRKLLLLCLALPFFLPAQDTKGVRPINPSTNPPVNRTRAVVVGISDYQDLGIPDLKYAHRDAEAFANFLRSPAGGALDGDHLKVLTNEQATGAQFAKMLDWLIEVTQEGDRVIIYFSGHGDVETRRISQPGYLLGFDAPSRVYSAGGAMNIRDFQDIISTLSVINKAKVLVFTDACHAGKLSGSDINGAQLTGQNLAQQFANEIKILSCQPNEYSIEGEQWGGGRGAFSFHLVDALYGLADGNNDLSVNLKEVGRYLEDHVTAEVAPVSQNPKVIGSPTERLAAVNPNLLADLRSGKTSQMQMLYPVEMRGMEDEVLADVDTTVRELYHLFKKALQDKAFLEPADACADAYYQRLTAEPRLARLHSTMRRNYAAALQDDAQQVLNSFLKTDMREITRTRRKKIEKYRLYPALLDRAAQLLGPEHYFYSELLSRKNIFEGFLQQLQSSRLNDREAGNKILQFYREALRWQPDNPLTFHFIARMYSNFMADLDSVEAYILRAAEHAPGWVLPMGEFAFDLTDRFQKHERAQLWLDKAYSMDSTSAYIMNQYGILNAQKNRFQEADSLFKKALAYDSTNIWYLSNYAHNCELMGKFRESEQGYLKSIRFDSTNVMPYRNLGNLYIKLREYEKAERWYKKSIEVDSSCSRCISGLGILYANTDRPEEAKPLLHKALEIEPTNIWAWNNLGNVYMVKKEYPAAIDAYAGVLGVDSTMPYATYAYSGTGIALERTGKPDEAIGAFRRAIALDSTNIWAMCGWVRALLKKGAPADAAALLDQAKTIQASDWVGYHFALLYAQTGRPELAIERLNAVVKKISILDYDELNSEVLLEPLHALPEWAELMKKHFPEKTKD